MRRSFRRVSRLNIGRHALEAKRKQGYALGGSLRAESTAWLGFGPFSGAALYRYAFSFLLAEVERIVHHIFLA